MKLEKLKVGDTVKYLAMNHYKYVLGEVQSINLKKRTADIIFYIDTITPQAYENTREETTSRNTQYQTFKDIKPATKKEKKYLQENLKPRIIIKAL